MQTYYDPKTGRTKLVEEPGEELDEEGKAGGVQRERSETEPEPVPSVWHRILSRILWLFHLPRVRDEAEAEFRAIVARLNKINSLSPGDPRFRVEKDKLEREVREWGKLKRLRPWPDPPELRGKPTIDWTQDLEPKEYIATAGPIWGHPPPGRDAVPQNKVYAHISGEVVTEVAKETKPRKLSFADTLKIAEEIATFSMGNRATRKIGEDPFAPREEEIRAQCVPGEAARGLSALNRDTVDIHSLNARMTNMVNGSEKGVEVIHLGKGE